MSKASCTMNKPVSGAKISLKRRSFGQKYHSVENVHLIYVLKASAAPYLMRTPRSSVTLSDRDTMATVSAPFRRSQCSGSSSAASSQAV